MLSVWKSLKFVVWESVKMGERLTLYQTAKFLDSSKLKAFADGKMDMTKYSKLVLEKVENIMVKGENPSILSFSYNVFKRLLYQGH